MWAASQKLKYLENIKYGAKRKRDDDLEKLSADDLEELSAELEQQIAINEMIRLDIELKEQIYRNKIFNSELDEINTYIYG